MCGCANRVINDQSLTSFNENGTLSYSSQKNDCQDLTRTFELVKVRDHFLNTDTLPESGEVTRIELLDTIPITTHVINTNNWCGMHEKINYYYDKLGVATFGEVS